MFRSLSDGRNRARSWGWAILLAVPLLAAAIFWRQHARLVEPASSPPAAADRLGAMAPQSVVLYFPDVRSAEWRPAREELLLPAELLPRLQRLAQLYLADPRHQLGYAAGAAPPLALFVTGEGTLVVDFSAGEFPFPRSAANERAFFRGLARTLLEAAPQLSQLRWLVRGNAPLPEEWHIDWRRPVSREAGGW